MKKRILIALILCHLHAWNCKAQFVTGNGLYIEIGTVFSVDSLVFVPTEALNLGNNYSLKVNYTAVPGNPNASIKKTYVFNNPVNFEGNLGVIYNPSQLNGNTESLLEMANSFSDESAFVTMTGCTRDLGMHKVSKAVSGLDIRMLTLVNGQSALPVKLVTFEAKKNEKSVALAWETSFESNSDFFDIERSHDGKNWETLGQVATAGESKQLVNYEFTDYHPLGGLNYYRLKMVDRDGTFAYSQIRKVLGDANALFVFPNPAADRLEMDVKDWSKVVRVSIVNASGEVVSERRPLQTLPEKSLPLTGFKPGNYILQINYRDGSSERTHFVKY